MSRPSKKRLSLMIRKGLDDTALQVNKALRGKGVSKLEPVLARVGHGGRLPHWYKDLRAKGILPNLDGKTIGSVVEILAMNESWAKKVFRFLAYVNQGDWLARKILALVDDIQNEEQVCRGIDAALKDFDRRKKIASRLEKPLLPDSYRKAIEQIRQTKPLHLGVIDAADNWVIETQKDAGRPPNDNEWNRLKRSPLDGLIGMSFALQWRYNFGRLFNSGT